MGCEIDGLCAWWLNHNCTIVRIAVSLGRIVGKGPATAKRKMVATAKGMHADDGETSACVVGKFKCEKEGFRLMFACVYGGMHQLPQYDQM